MEFFTYILFSQKLTKYYTGSTDNIAKRLLEHNRGKTPFTKTGMPWVLAYYESFPSRSQAFRREKYIKNQKSVIYIKSLVEKFSSADTEHPDL
jgi:putative endonuclease